MPPDLDRQRVEPILHFRGHGIRARTRSAAPERSSSLVAGP